MLRLEDDGAQRFSGFCDREEIDRLGRLLSRQPPIAGSRIYDSPELADWLSAESGIAGLASSLLGSAARPVRAILFDKSKALNWSLGWHQDRTIAVKRRIETPGFDRWTIKAGVTHVEPPFDIIEQSLTMRIHLDPVTEDNAPLLIAVGSHRLGRLEEQAMDRIVERCGTAACLANAGDVWVYRTAILHSSAVSRSDAQRRVLQVDYSALNLPNGLDWAGIA